MAILPNLRQLIFPRKNKTDVDSMRTNWQTAEIWARQPIQQLVAGSNITLTPSSGLATDAKGNGPFPITIAASGGGSGITTLASPDNSIAITNPTGPTTDVDVQGYPFLNTPSGIFSDANDNVGYGSQCLGSFAGLAHARSNAAFGFDTLAAIVDTPGATGNTAVGHSSLAAVTSSGDNTGIGRGSFINVTTGAQNTGVGSLTGGSTTTGGQNTAVGYDSGSTSAALSHTTCLGFATGAQANGTVAIGCDNLGFAAVATNVNDFVLGTDLHVVNFLNIHTGSNTMDLGTNSPATGPHPAGWIKIRDSGGAIGYIPYWT